MASTTSDEKEKGELLTKILIDLTEKVFSINSSNRNSIDHNSFRKRYDEVLKKLKNTFNTYPSRPISPRVVTSLLPHIINYILRKFQSTYPNHTESLYMKSGLTDLSIEILRLGNLRVSEGEITNEQKEKIELAKASLVSLLKNYLFEFYTQTEIDVQIYSKSGAEKKKG